MHLIYGGFFALMTLMIGAFGVAFAIVLANVPPDPGAPPPVFFIVLMAFFVGIYGLLSLPSILAGYAMLKRRSWAKIAGIIAAIISAISFPFGTALCVYSLWFFFGGGGSDYERVVSGANWHGTLGGPSTSSYGWESHRTADERSRQYVPPVEPPSWRD
jgi:hypothetical protein